MFGVVRHRFFSSITENHSRLPPLNRNNRKLITTTSTSPGTAAQLPNCPPVPSQAGSGWIDKLKSQSLKYWNFGSVARSLVGSTVFLSYMFPNLSPYSDAGTIPAKNHYNQSEVQKESHHSGMISSFEEMVANAKVDFPYDEKDLLEDESIRKLYERWLTHHGVARHPWKKEAHYQAFKNNAYRFYFYNKAHKDCLFELTKFADMTEKDKKKVFHQIEY